MKYCLSLGLHNLFFDIAIVDQNHKIINKYKCGYDRNKDISMNIYLAYKKYFSLYSIKAIGIGISNNITFKDDFLYGVKSFTFNRYDLKNALSKLFEVDIYIFEETHLAALACSHKLDSNSLLFIIIDTKISNSFVFDKQIVELEEDIDLRLNEDLNTNCCKGALKSEFLRNNFDDEYICEYFLSNNVKCKEIIGNWAKILDKCLGKIVKEFPVNKVIFSGYIGEYFEEFKDYLSITKKFDCSSINNHREQTLIGVSHLIFKDN